MKDPDCKKLYENGKHYDHQHERFRDDIPFYLEMSTRFRDPILEIACGTGRITIPIAEKGFNITGIDISKGMLDEAERKVKGKDLDIEFFKADCRYFNLNKKFNLIFIPFNSFLHIQTREGVESCFNNVKRHMASEDSRFILDIFNPVPNLLIRNPEHQRKVCEYPDPYSDKLIEIFEDNLYDLATQINYIKWHYIVDDKEEYVRELNMRIFYPQEIDALLHYNGFEILEKWGDFDKSPFHSDSPKQLILCRKK